MAGSYKHVITKSGKLNTPKRVCGMLECSSGDVYEAVEEMYGMIWWLAQKLDVAVDLLAVEGYSVGDPQTGQLPNDKAELVEMARQQYKAGLMASPGTKR